MKALVTGASSGLGSAICRAIDRKNIPLIITGRNSSALNALASELTLPAEIFPADLSIKEERNEILALIQQQKPTLVINCAGFGLYGPAVDHSPHDTNEMIELNIKAYTEITLTAARALIAAQKKGTILNVSSAAAYFSYPTFSLYAASKAFVNRFSEALDSELAPQGVRVLTCCPGKIETPFRKRASKGLSQSTDSSTMSATFAANEILDQIDRGQRIRIIDWRYRIIVCLTRLLPNSWLFPLLQKQLKGKY